MTSFVVALEDQFERLPEEAETRGAVCEVPAQRCGTY
jgi:hypothetical protein